MQKCGGLFTSKSVGKTWLSKTPAKMCCTFLGKSAGEACRVFPALLYVVVQETAVTMHPKRRRGCAMSTSEKETRNIPTRKPFLLSISSALHTIYIRTHTHTIVQEGNQRQVAAINRS